MSSLPNSLADLDETTVLSRVQEDLTHGRPAVGIIGDLKDGMTIVGKRFQKGEYFLTELIMSAEIFKTALKLLEPRLSTSHQNRTFGKIVIGTVEGDIHDIGKNIVIAFLKSAGFEVFDLGVDVSPRKFITKVKETGASILGLSCLLTPGFDAMQATIRKLDEERLRRGVKVMIGGAAGAVVTKDWVKQLGADAFAVDCIQGVQLAKAFVKVSKKRKR
jgi:methylmalonyl-CoA mutase cobalamin-binding domain/chain